MVDSSFIQLANQYLTQVSDFLERSGLLALAAQFICCSTSWRFSLSSLLMSIFQPQQLRRQPHVLPLLADGK